MEEKVTEETGIGQIPWTVGDIAKGIGMVIAITILIAFGLGIGTVILVGPDALVELGGLNIGGFLDFLESEGLLQLWLILLFVAMAVGEGAMPLGAWLFSAFKYHCGWHALGFRPFKVKNGLILAAAVAVIGLSISLLYEWLMASLAGEPSTDLSLEFTQTGLSMAMFVVLAVVVAPIAEETFLRGFVLGGLGKRFGYGWGAVLSALLFSIAHMQPGALLPIFILGLLLAWLYIRTGSIWPCIFTHAAYNSIAILFMVI